mmetsp:Transcript_7918/g.14368  ORF Transcript_7918/g.14368 Transcript_7918/m.14368 type:complete len:171 (-) Transcript_7918:71-583(-)
MAAAEPAPIENHLKTGGEQKECQGKGKAGTVSDDCYPTFEQLKIRRKHKFIIFKIDTETEEIVVETTGAKKATLEEFKAALPYTECRYCVYEHEYKTHDGRPTDKLFFMSWMPNNATPYGKMAYAEAKGVIRALLDGVFDTSASNLDQIEVEFGIKEEEGEESDGDPDDW